MGRRSFLGLVPFGAAGCVTPAAAARPAASAASTAGAAASPTGRWSSLRDDFLLARDRVHLGNLLFASNPRPVREAIERHRRRLDEDPVGVIEQELQSKESHNATLDAAARYMAVARDDLALTDSTTSGISLVYLGLTLQRGDEIVTTKHDHFVTHEALRQVAERTGAVVRAVPLYEEGRAATGDGMAAALEQAITPASRIVAVTWVHSSTGVKTPVKAFSAAVGRANASRRTTEKILLCVDGVHGFGVEDATLPDLGCDVFIAGCHKWILGPHGTGIVWATKEAWDRIRPTGCPFDWPYVAAREWSEGAMPPPSAATRSPGGFRAFEHRWALREAFDYHLTIGKTPVQQRLHELATRCKKGLAGMKHVTLHTPLDPALSSAIVTFEVAGLKPTEVVEKLLASRIVATTTPYRPSYARFAPGIVNTEEEIDAALAAVERLS